MECASRRLRRCGKYICVLRIVFTAVDLWVCVMSILVSFGIGGRDDRGFRCSEIGVVFVHYVSLCIYILISQ